MPDPGPLRVVEPVRQPLRLQQLEPVPAEVQGLAAFEVAVLLVVVVQVQAAPQAGAAAADDDDVGGGDDQEDGGAGAAVGRVPHRLRHLVPPAARRLQAHQRAARQAHGRLLGRGAALRAHAQIIAEDL